jgi:hypothetical protein
MNFNLIKRKKFEFPKKGKEASDIHSKKVPHLKFFITQQ